MISSTFTDLKAHRAALIEALHKHKLHANVMEHDDAKVSHDVIDSSLTMVRDSAAYILVIGFKYGQTPEDATRNPAELSVTELEFNEAQRLERPILLFIMGDDHPVKKSDIETDPKKEEMLNAFRKRAKVASPHGKVNRVYSVFNSLEEFKDKIASSLNELCQLLDSNGKPASESSASSEKSDPHSIPKAPAFYAEPDYIGSHRFIGRESQLQELSDWAKPADPTNLLLFEAIGGNGKSMLTWEWATNPKCALASRPIDSPWAGRFWYSFYERGAIMADFCHRALAYMTGRPLENFAKKKTAELAKDLLAQLHAQPWLLILDGLERVLVAYHRIDAAEVPDEEVNIPTDKIVDRNPCDAIRDEDNDLLRALAAARPSKILVSSRLTPRMLLNPSGQTVPGARRIDLPGLRPADAEALLRSCGRETDKDPGIRGDSAAIQAYLTENCDNHPLVIGVLGGLINNYLPDRGNFDAWVSDLDGGARLDLASLDLIQRRNHILRAALDALSPTSRQLLSTLSLVSESVDFEVLEAFNPHIPPEPTFVEDPDEVWIPFTEAELTKRQDAYRALSPEEKKEEDAARGQVAKKYENEVQRRKEYVKALADWKVIASSPAARQALTKTVRDLEDRGLLQFDPRTRRYDLHPVVRGVASGVQRADEKEGHGKRVVDHFSAISKKRYPEADALEDVRPDLNVVRTLIKLGHIQQAMNEYRGELSTALLFNIEAYVEVLSLLRPLFPKGWKELPQGLEPADAGYLANAAAICLDHCGESEQALAAYGASVRSALATKDWVGAATGLRNISRTFKDQNQLANALRVDNLALDLATLCDDHNGSFMGRLFLFVDLVQLGQWTEAAGTWELLDTMGRDWPRNVYRPGMAEHAYLKFQFRQGHLQEAQLATVERLATEGKNRGTVRDLHWLRGAWRLEQGAWALAAASFVEALRMARERGRPDADSETGLALAKHHLDELSEPEREAERLAKLREPAHRYLAMLWHALGDLDQAKRHALAAYKWAWADGEPYVNRYELTKTTELLDQLYVPIPSLAHYDPAKEEPFPWEAELRAAMEKLRAEKQAY